MSKSKGRFFNSTPPKFKLVLSDVRGSWILEILSLILVRGLTFILTTRVDRTWLVNGCRLLEWLPCTLRMSTDWPVLTHVVWHCFEHFKTTLRYVTPACTTPNSMWASGRLIWVHSVMLYQLGTSLLALSWLLTTIIRMSLKYIISMDGAKIYHIN